MHCFCCYEVDSIVKFERDDYIDLVKAYLTYIAAISWTCLEYSYQKGYN